MRSFLPVSAIGGHTEHTEIATVALLRFAQFEMHFGCLATIIVFIDINFASGLDFQFPDIKIQIIDQLESIKNK